MNERPILIGLGANLPSPYGTPRQTLAAALDYVRDIGLEIGEVSPFYESAPVPDDGSPWYVNAVASVHWSDAPEALMQFLLTVEAEFGRKRDEKNAPRTLDLDLLAFSDEMIDAPGLTVPHPRLHERAFVLQPLFDVCPDWTHPASGLGIEDMIAGLPPGQSCRKIVETEKGVSL